MHPEVLAISEQAFGNLFGKVVLLDLFVKIHVRPSLLLGDRQGVPLHALGIVNKKRFQFPKSNPRAIEGLSHLPAAHDRQITAKQHPIETGKHAMNAILVLLDEFFHRYSPPAGGRRGFRPYCAGRMD